MNGADRITFELEQQRILYSPQYDSEPILGTTYKFSDGSSLTPVCRAEGYLMVRHNKADGQLHGYSAHSEEKLSEELKRRRAAVERKSALERITAAARALLACRSNDNLVALQQVIDEVEKERQQCF